MFFLVCVAWFAALVWGKLLQPDQEADGDESRPPLQAWLAICLPVKPYWQLLCGLLEFSCRSLSLLGLGLQRNLEQALRVQVLTAVPRQGLPMCHFIS